MKYSYGIKEDKKLGIFAIVLQDGTHVVISKGKDKGVSFMYPKKKFSKIFRKQMQDRKTHFIGLAFSVIELQAIMKGLDKLLSRKTNVGGTG